MLEKVIALIGGLFFLLGFALTAALFIAMIGQWYMLQSEAQFLAASQGRYGGYTVEADAQLRQFVQEHNLDRSKLKVIVSAPNAPKPWGQAVTAEITYPFDFKVGSFIKPFTVSLTGKGEAVSMYIPGTLNVVYTSP